LVTFAAKLTTNYYYYIAAVNGFGTETAKSGTTNSIFKAAADDFEGLL